MKAKLLKKSVALTILITVLVVLLVLKQNMAVCEFFATTFARGWIFVFGHLFGWLPISLFELFIIVAICFAVYFLAEVIYLACKRRGAKLLNFVATVLIAVFLFVDVYTATASMSYNRKPLDLPSYNINESGALDYEQAYALADKLVDEANFAYESTDHDEDGNIVFPYTFAELGALVAEEYKKLNSDYFSSYTPTLKRIVNKTVMSEMHIVGVFFAPTGEANINGNENSCYLPHTMAHELAHSKGVMVESDANLVALHVLLNSQNPYLRYSALMWCMYDAIALVSMYKDSADDVAALRQKICDGIRMERSNYVRFWAQFTLVSDLGNTFNDIYLKLNGQSGTDSYVAPQETVDTGEEDSYGEPILEIIRYSDVQGLLIYRYLEGDFPHYASAE